MKIIEFLLEDGKFVQLDKTAKLILAHWRHDETVPNSLQKRFRKSTDSEILQYFTDLITRYVTNKIKSLKQDVAISWLLKAYSNGTPFEDLLRRGGTALQQYADLLHSKKFIGNHSDLNTYRNVEELERYIDALYSKETRGASVDLSKALAVKIHEDENLLIVVPLNKEGAGKYGAGTRWCTTDQDCDYDDDDYDDDDEEEYDRYGVLIQKKKPEFDPDAHVGNQPVNSFVRDGSTFASYFSQGPLVIFIDRKNPDKKFQFHAPSNQAMDPADDEISADLFKQNYPGAITKAAKGLVAHQAEFTNFIKNVSAQAAKFQKTFRHYE